MSLLSNFVGSESAGYSAFRGVINTPISATNSSFFTFPNNYQNYTDNSAISWDQTNNEFLSDFYYSGGVTVALVGWSQVVGIGNATITQGSTSTISMNYTGTQSINKLLLRSMGAANATFNKSSGNALTSIYNLGIRARGGGISLTAFNDNTSLTTVTMTELTATSAGTTDFRLINCALTAQSVENILVTADNCCPSGLGGNLGINLSGGTSSGASALTSAASAARTSLIAKGATITLNP